MSKQEEQPKQFKFMKKSDVAPLIHGYGPFGSPATELSPGDIKDEGDFKTAGGYTIGWSDAAKERHKAEKHPITETGQVIFGFDEEMAKSRAGAMKVGARMAPTPKEFGGKYTSKADAAAAIYGYGPFGSPPTTLDPSDIHDEGEYSVAGGIPIGPSAAAKARRKGMNEETTK